MKRLIWLLFLLPLGLAQAEPRLLARQGGWRVYEWDGPQGRQCYLQAQGQAEGQGARFLIANRPADAVRDEINIQLDNPAQGDVRLAMGGKTYRMFAQGSQAWSRDAPMDKAIVQEMLKSARATLYFNGVSLNFDLKGFARARDTMLKACPVP